MEQLSNIENMSKQLSESNLDIRRQLEELMSRGESVMSGQIKTFEGDSEVVYHRKKLIDLFMQKNEQLKSDYLLAFNDMYNYLDKNNLMSMIEIATIRREVNSSIKTYFENMSFFYITKIENYIQICKDSKEFNLELLTSSIINPPEINMMQQVKEQIAPYWNMFLKFCLIQITSNELNDTLPNNLTSIQGTVTRGNS